MGHARRFLSQQVVPISKINPENVNSFLMALIQQEKSHAYISQALSALRYWITKVEARSGFQKCWVHPKRQRKLPTVLTLNEIMRLLGSIPNLKHRTILTLIYSSGLRISEVVQLKRADVDSNRNTLHIRQGKGRKDRVTVLSKAAFQLLEAYMRTTYLEEYLFPSGEG